MVIVRRSIHYSIIYIIEEVLVKWKVMIEYDESNIIIEEKNQEEVLY